MKLHIRGEVAALTNEMTSGLGGTKDNYFSLFITVYYITVLTLNEHLYFNRRPSSRLSPNSHVLNENCTIFINYLKSGLLLCSKIVLASGSHIPSTVPAQSNLLLLFWSGEQELTLKQVDCFPG